MASLVCTGVTARNALCGNVPLEPGQTVLFLGTGGVSIMGQQLAKAAGAIAIITSSSDEKLKFDQEHFGPDHIINYRTTPDWAAEVNRITDNHDADFAAGCRPRRARRSPCLAPDSRRPACPPA